MAHEGEKFVIYKDPKDSHFKRRLRSHLGGTLAESTSGHREKSACEAELSAFMADYPDVERLDTTASDHAR